MSIDRDYEFKELTIYCDDKGCNESLEGFDLEGDFSEIVSKLRLKGWQSVKEGGEWLHYCPACVKKRKEEAQRRRNIVTDFEGLT